MLYLLLLACEDIYGHHPGADHAELRGEMLNGQEAEKCHDIIYCLYNKKLIYSALCSRFNKHKV